MTPQTLPYDFAVARKYPDTEHVVPGRLFAGLSAFTLTSGTLTRVKRTHKPVNVHDVTSYTQLFGHYAAGHLHALKQECDRCRDAVADAKVDDPANVARYEERAKAACANYDKWLKAYA